MGHQVRFVVSHTPSIDDAVLLDWLKRLVSPKRLVARRLNVVVGVEKDRRRIRTTLDLGEDYRRRIGKVDGLYILHSDVAKQSDDEVVGFDDLLGWIAGKCDRGNGSQVLEITDKIWEKGFQLP